MNLIIDLNDFCAAREHIATGFDETGVCPEMPKWKFQHGISIPEM
ncbi:MAG: hypothetical protein PHC50_04250 [Candidatus Cloacimonetes bacterium]|nr:hypothetical protein [Candidatus Cloacimonadota bacterium]